MSPEQLAAYLEVIKSFAEPTVQEVFNLTVKAVYIRNLLSLVALVLAEILFVAISAVAFRKAKELEDSYGGEDFLAWMVLTGAVICFIVVALCIPSVATNLMVPEARAIQILLHGTE